MRRRRHVLQGLLALLLLPTGLPVGLARTAPAGAAAAGSGAAVHLVNGWILTDRDLAALAAIDRARR